MTKAAFQGERGAFSEEATRQLLGDDVDVLPCETFDDVFEAVKDGRTTCAVAPIENSLAGSVLRTYELPAATDLTITGEAYVRIALNLSGHRGAKLAEIRRVSS